MLKDSVFLCKEFILLFQIFPLRGIGFQDKGEEDLSYREQRFLCDSASDSADPWNKAPGEIWQVRQGEENLIRHLILQE